MDLKPNSGSDRAWVWTTLADYADESPKAELLAIRFLNAESEYCAGSPRGCYGLAVTLCLGVLSGSC